MTYPDGRVNLPGGDQAEARQSEKILDDVRTKPDSLVDLELCEQIADELACCLCRALLFEAGPEDDQNTSPGIAETAQTALNLLATGRAKPIPRTLRALSVHPDRHRSVARYRSHDHGCAVHTGVDGEPDALKQMAVQPGKGRWQLDRMSAPCLCTIVADHADSRYGAGTSR